MTMRLFYFVTRGNKFDLISNQSVKSDLTYHICAKYKVISNTVVLTTAISLTCSVVKNTFTHEPRMCTYIKGNAI